MAIVNRHIPLDWQRFYVEPHDTRQKRLCGSRGISEYEGIPGITPQALDIDGRAGWCYKCIDVMFDWYKDNYKKIVTIPEVHAVYDIVFFEMFRFMQHVVVNKIEVGPRHKGR